MLTWPSSAPARQGSPATAGHAVNAKLSDPTRAGIDHHGNVLIADEGNDRVRVIATDTGTFYGQKMTADHIYYIAGGGATPRAGREDLPARGTTAGD